MKAVFLDRDGTINIDKEYLFKIEDFEYHEGVKEGLKLFQDAGYKLIVVTNQSGMARGYYSEEDYAKLMDWLAADLRELGIVITADYYCPHLKEAAILKYAIDCEYRKPKIGMYLQARNECGIDFNESIVIGDKMRDLQICFSKVGNKMQGFLVYADKPGREGNIHKIKGGILEAAEEVLGV